MSQYVVGQRPTHRVEVGAASVGVVAVAAVDGAGTVIPMGAVVDNADGTYDVTPTSPYTLPTVIELTWTWSTNTVVTVDEIVGSALFTVDEIREYRSAGLLTPLSSVTDYPEALLRDWRETVAGAFELRTGRAHHLRYCRIEAAGTGTRTLSPRAARRRVSSSGRPVGGEGSMRDLRRVLSVTVDGTAVATSDVRIVDDTFHRVDTTWPTGTSDDPTNVAIEYEYGYESWEARKHGLTTLATRAVRPDWSPFATSISNPDGSQAFPAGGWAWPPEVFDWLRRADRTIAIA